MSDPVTYAILSVGAFLVAGGIFSLIQNELVHKYRMRLLDYVGDDKTQADFDDKMHWFEYDVPPYGNMTFPSTLGWNFDKLLPKEHPITQDYLNWSAKQ